MKKILSKTWLILYLFIAFQGIGTAKANGNLTIVVKNPNPYIGNQSWFTYEKKPGESLDDIAVIKNLSDTTLKAHVYPVDATSNESGSFILKMENEARTGIGKWTTLQTNDTVIVPPQQSIDVPFHIEVPSNVTPGQYFGGIVLEEINDPAQIIGVAAIGNSGEKICCTNILVKTRIGLRIYLTVPGTIKDSMEWSKFQSIQKDTSTNFQFEIKNTGNVALEPDATIEIFDGFGNQVDRFEKKLGECLPGTSISPIITWDHQPLFGSFKAVAHLNYQIKSQTIDQSLHSSPEMTTKSVNFNIIPWNLMVIIAICLVILTSGMGIYRHKQNAIRKNWGPYKVQPNDNIMSIAAEYNIDWKKLGRVNKIKPPYLLKTDDTLRVPKNNEHKQAPSPDIKNPDTNNK